MSKRPIIWHKECLEIREEYLDQLLCQIDRLRIQSDRLIRENNFYRVQISRAIAENKDSFDRDRYCRRNKKQ